MISGLWLWLSELRRILVGRSAGWLSWVGVMEWFVGWGNVVLAVAARWVRETEGFLCWISFSIVVLHIAYL